MRALWVLIYREWVRFFRQPSRLIGSIITPLMIWILVGGGLGAEYMAWFVPGMIVMSVLFTAIFSTMSVIEDRHAGFLQGVLVSPVNRSTIALAKILSGAGLGLFQGLLLIGTVFIFNANIELFHVLIAIGIMVLIAMGLTGLGFMFAWKIDSVQGYHSIMNIVLMPMWMLSGALFKIEGAHPIMEMVMKINPLAYVVPELQILLNPVVGILPNLSVAIGVSMLFAFIGFGLSLFVMKKS